MVQAAAIATAPLAPGLPDPAFRWDLPVGRCVGVRIGNDGEGLPPAEQAWAESLAPPRQREFVAGRQALHAVAGDLGVRLGAVLPDPSGAPRIPTDLTGSISHKGALAVALLAPRRGATLGVDLEQLAPARPRIARLVLSPVERDDLAGLPQDQRWWGLLLRFSIKEAVFKALHPYAPGPLDLRDLEVTPDSRGHAAVRLPAAQRHHAWAQAGWLRFEDYVLTWARYTPETVG